MTWNELTLSTTNSIARHQSNINQLCEEIVTQSKLQADSSSYIELSVYETIEFAVINTNSGSHFKALETEYPAGLQQPFTFDYIPDSGIYEYITSVYVKYIQIDDVKEYSCGLCNLMDQGQLGIQWSDDTQDTFIVLHGVQIISVLQNGTWQQKIDLAKDKLKTDMILKFNQINLLRQSIDNIKNPDDLIIPCDYLALALIYTELSLNGLNQIYVQKRNWYWKQYMLALQNAIMTIDVGYNWSPNTNTGKLSI